VSSVAFDVVAGFFDVVGTSFGRKVNSLLVSLAGATGRTASAPKEIAERQQAWNSGTLAVFANPLDPTTSGRPKQAGAVGLRTADGVVPIAWHDPRVDEAFPNGVAKGTVAFAGYGKGFYSISLVDKDDEASPGIHTLYAPYAFDGEGVPAKAHSITLNTKGGKESISVVHAEGHAVLLDQDGNAIIRSKDGANTIQVSNSGIFINGNLTVNGGATIGNPTAPIPLVSAPALVAYITSLESAIAAALGAITPAGGGPAAQLAYVSHALAVTALTAALPTTKVSGF